VVEGDAERWGCQSTEVEKSWSSTGAAKTRLGFGLMKWNLFYLRPDYLRTYFLLGSVDFGV
jgi:hypothetical protein